MKDRDDVGDLTFFGGPYGINSFKKMQDLTTLVHQVRGTEAID
ncbi:hypothetical protein [Ignatzschineria cameli]|nr:hypothetical protein [Ignatzschineria cameli]